MAEEVVYSDRHVSVSASRIAIGPRHLRPPEPDIRESDPRPREARLRRPVDRSRFYGAHDEQRRAITTRLRPVLSSASFGHRRRSLVFLGKDRIPCSIRQQFG